MCSFSNLQSFIFQQFHSWCLASWSSLISWARSSFSFLSSSSSSIFSLTSWLHQASHVTFDDVVVIDVVDDNINNAQLLQPKLGSYTLIVLFEFKLTFPYVKLLLFLLSSYLSLSTSDNDNSDNKRLSQTMLDTHLLSFSFLFLLQSSS